MPLILLKHVCRLLSLLSIDVAAGAVVSAAWVATLLGREADVLALATLGLSVWIIYTADHLADAKRLKTVASTDRHRFHQKHYFALVVVTILAIILVAGITFFLPAAVLQGGLSLSLMVALYFTLQSRLRFLKELAGATLYSWGVLIPSFPLSLSGIVSSSGLIFAGFFLTALINLVMFSWFDYASDREDGRTSVGTLAGPRSTKALLVILFLCQAFLVMGLFYLRVEMFTVVTIVSMNLLLLLILQQHQWFSQHNRYRYAGDAVFLFPLISLLLS